MLKMIRNVFAVLVLSLASLAAFASPLDINKASATEISEVMVGIGQSKAAAIVAYRDANGAFKSVDELVLVKGIGEKTVAKNRDKLFVSQE